jgi:predicted phage tail protein
MSDLAELKPLEGEIIRPDEDIQIITILNAFDPKDFTITPMPWRNDLVVRDLMPAALAHFDYVVSINGQVIEGEILDKTYVKPADRVVMCPVPQGGDGGGKAVLRIVALIAVAVFAPYLEGYIAPYLGASFAAGTLGAAALTAGITVAGSMLVNALLPVKPTQDNTSAEKDPQTYGIDGPKNTSLEGIAVPVCYGTHRMAGNVLGLYVENVDQTQMVYMLLNAGEGPVMNISDIELNDQAIGDFKNVEWVTRMGTGDQALIDWFQDSFTAVNVNVKLPKDSSFFSYTTSGSCDKLRFDFVCPNGIWKADKGNGSLQSYTVPLLIQYRRVGDSIWTTLADQSIVNGQTVDNDPPPTDVTDHDPNDVGPGQGGSGTGLGSIAYRFAASTQTTLKVTGPAITDKSRSVVRRSFSTPKLTFGQYEIQIKRITAESTDEYISDQVYIGDINLITASKVAYNWTSLVGIKVKLTDQLNGLPQVTYINHGRIIKTWDRASRSWIFANSSNPAWVVLDMLTHWRYGGQVEESRIDLEQFKAWAKHCDDENLQFNGVLDATENLWDQMQKVCRIGHAQVVNIGTRWSVVMEKADTPVMMFGVGAIKKGSFKLNWLPMTERANEIEVTFFDKTDRYKQKTIKVYDPAILTAGRPQRTSAITLIGCTDELTAVSEGALQLNLNRYLLQTCEFEAPLESIGCAIGSVIYVQHDMPNWEQSGRTAPGSTTSVIELDRNVDFVTGTPYKLLLHYPSVQVGSGTVSVVDSVNHYLQVTSVPGVKFTRINVGGRDRACQVAETTSGSFIWVEDTAGITVGGAYTLYDTDVIVEADVVNPGTSSVDSVTLTTPLTVAAPEQFVQWMFGPVTKIKRPFRVRAISAGSSDVERHITALQYDERVYSIDTSGYNGPGGPLVPGDTGYALSNDQNLSVYEEVFVSGAQVKNRVVLAWSPPAYGVYKGTDIWVGQLNDRGQLGEPLKKVGDVVGSNRFPMDADIGTTLRFKAVAYDMFDKRVNFDDAPTIDYTVTGAATTPPVPRPPSGLVIEWAGRDCKLYWRYNSVTNSYDIGSEPYGADSGFVDPSVLDYELKIYHNENDANYPASPDWKLVRTAYTQNPAFTYTWEMNSEDGLHRHLKFEIRVRMKVGPPSLATIAEAYNPPIPAITPILTGVDFQAAAIAYVKPGATDFAGVQVYLSTTDPAPIDADHLIYDGPNTQIVIPNLDFFTDYYIAIGGYDTFGTSGMTFSALHFKTTYFDVNAIANGMIGADLLTSLLQSRIDLVDGDMPGSVNARILGEAADRGAAVLAEQTARQTADSSLASRADSVYAALAGVGSAAAQEAIMAQLTAAGGISSMYDALSVVVDNNHAAFLSQVSAQATVNSATTTSITTLTSTVNNKNRTFYQGTTPTSTSGYTLVVGDLWINTSAGNARMRWDGTTWVSAPEYAETKNRTFAQNSAPSSTTDYTLQVGDLWVDTLHDNKISRWFGSAWVLVDDLRTGANTTSIQTLQSTTDGLSGQWTVKIDNNGYVCGFGLASSATSHVDPAGGPPYWSFSSTFEVIADSFQVRQPGSTAATKVPFSVGNYTDPISHTTSTVVTIDQALISDASIDTLRIAGSAITVPLSGSGGGGSITTSPSTVASVGYTTPGGASQVPSAMICNGVVNVINSGGSAVSVYATISVNGVTVASSGISLQSGFSGCIAIAGAHTGLATSTGYTYTLSVYQSGGATLTASGCNLTVMGSKR